MKRTYQPSILKAKRKHGFLKRNKTTNIIKSRRLKGRKRI